MYYCEYHSPLSSKKRLGVRTLEQEPGKGSEVGDLELFRWVKKGQLQSNKRNHRTDISCLVP